MLEKVLSLYNRKSTFKICALIVLSLPSFQYGSQMQNILLSIITPNFTCQFNSTEKIFSISANQCLININSSMTKCSNWNFSSLPIGQTLMSEFNLVCDYRNIGDSLLITWYGTFLLGPLFGYLAEIYGRKKITLIALCFETICVFAIALTRNFVINSVFRILLGISNCSFYICYIWLIEIVDNDFRDVVGSFIWLYCSLATMASPLIVYVTKNWRITQLISSIPNIFYIAIIFIPESPRWLCVVNRKKELFETLKVIAKINNLNFKLCHGDVDIEKEIEEKNLWRAFKNSNFLLLMSISLLAVFSLNLLFSAIITDLKLMSNNIYISMFLLGLAEIPAIILSFYSLRYFKRKSIIIFTSLLGATFNLLSVLLQMQIFWQSIIRIILGSLAKCFVTIGNQNILVYASELFPTTHRSLLMGMIQIVYFLSFIVAIYINKLIYIHAVIPMIIYFLFNFIASLILFSLSPETKDLPIPESLADQKMLIKGNEKNYLIYMKSKFDYISFQSEFSSDTTNEDSSLQVNWIQHKKNIKSKNLTKHLFENNNYNMHLSKTFFTK